MVNVFLKFLIVKGIIFKVLPFTLLKGIEKKFVTEKCERYEFASGQSHIDICSQS